MTRLRLSEAVRNAIEELRDTAGYLETISQEVPQHSRAAHEAASDLRLAATNLEESWPS